MKSIWKMVAIFTAAMLVSRVVAAYDIPADRRAVWQGNVGVSGGIPNRPSEIDCVANYNVPTDGVTAAQTAINSCLNGISVEQTAYLPAGTYTITGGINIPSHKTLRGAGPGLTVIRANQSIGSAYGAGLVNMSGGYTTRTDTTVVDITSMTKGSPSITLTDSSAFSVGDYLFVDVLNGWWANVTENCGVFGGGRTRCYNTLHKITGKNGNTLTIEPPVFHPTYQSDSPQAVRVSHPMRTRAGVENLTLRNDTGVPNGANNNVYFQGASECWVKNIKVERCGRYCINAFFDNYRLEVRDSWIQECVNPVPSDNCYGTMLYHTTGALIENNIYDHTSEGPIVGNAQGSVIAYNYGRRTHREDPGSPGWFMGGIWSHLLQSSYNLYEGNDFEGIALDNIHGSSSHQTIFRGRYHGRKPGDLCMGPATCDDSIYAVALNRYQYWMNIVGNVVGSDGYSTIYDATSYPLNGAKAVYVMGYEMGGSDSEVFNTLLRHANYDYVTDSQKICGTTGEPDCQGGTSDSNLPASLYLASRPSWWCAEVPWPPIGPDLDPMASDIPAKRRFEGLPCTVGPVTCPNGSCESASGENCATCPADCPTPAGQVCCAGALYAGDCCATIDCSGDENCVGHQCVPDTCADGDQDGHADAACGGDDCDDGDRAIHPGTEEVCDDGVDNDCDGLADYEDTTNCGSISGGCSCSASSRSAGPGLTAWLLLGLALWSRRRPGRWTGLLVVATLLAPGWARAAPWSGILDPSRAIDWSGGSPGSTTPGVEGGIPRRTTICATLDPGISAAQLSEAIQNCGSGEVVFLNAGTYSISGFDFRGKSQVTLRGAGPDQTFIVFSGSIGCRGPWGNVCVAPVNGWGPGGWNPNVVGWTAGYAQGTTTITLSSTAGLTPGSILGLDQVNDASDTGGVYVTDSSPPTLEAGSPCRDSGGRRCQSQVVKVTAVDGNQVSITPGLYMSNWRASQSPEAYWVEVIEGVSIENLSLDHRNLTETHESGIIFLDARNCWLKNIRSIRPTRNHVWFHQVTHHLEVRDSYFYGTRYAQSQSYGIEMFGQGSADHLVINNIFHGICAALMTGNAVGYVWAYNYAFDFRYVPPNGNTQWQQMDYLAHDAMPAMALFEGNETVGIAADIIHGSSALQTAFRNHLNGRDPLGGSVGGKTQHTVAVHLQAFVRAYNFVGNIMGTAGYHDNYEYAFPDGGGNPDTSVWHLGYGYNGYNDAVVKTSLLRWGNYDTVSAAVRWNAAEVPTTGIPYVGANPVPASQTLPASFFLTGKPAWWDAVIQWPAIGPDVTGGDVPDVGGHVHKNPAHRCYDMSAKDADGVLTHYNANNCYRGCSGPADCLYPPVCRTADGATCEAGGCVYPPAPAGAACEDGDACTTPDTCDGAGMCRPGPDTCPACVDQDADGYGDPASAACAHPERDCDDQDGAIHPGAAEACDDGVDNDCDGLRDGADAQDCPAGASGGCGCGGARDGGAPGGLALIGLGMLLGLVGNRQSRRERIGRRSTC